MPHQISREYSNVLHWQSLKVLVNDDLAENASIYTAQVCHAQQASVLKIHTQQRAA